VLWPEPEAALAAGGVSMGPRRDRYCPNSWFTLTLPNERSHPLAEIAGVSLAFGLSLGYVSLAG
jgi:hypothetical protein